MAFFSQRRLFFDADGRDWPNRESSVFVQAGDMRWHVQIMGEGPMVLMLHGAGASTHSWRDLAPLLAHRFRIVMPDLPGHGFTDPIGRGRLSLKGFARAVAALLARLDCAPDYVIGHSAGAAVLVQMQLDRAMEARAMIALNGALLPFDGLAGVFFPPMAKLMFLNPFTAPLLAHSADREAVARLIAETGSRLDRRGLDLYSRLMASPAHVDGTLAMMAHWDLEGLSRRLARLDLPVLLAVGLNDGAVPPAHATRIAAQLANARIERLPGLGHLAHEEAPEMVARLICAFLASAAAKECSDEEGA